MAMITCPECGEQYDEQAAHCPGCGFPTPAPLKCAECGAVITGTESVCRCCGAPIENAAVPMTVPMPSPAPTPNSSPDPAPPVSDPAPIYPNTNIGQSAKPKFIFLNIYALLVLIPTNIIMFGNIFTIKIAAKEFNFCIEEFSDVNSKISDIVSKVINIVGSFNAAEELKNATSILGTVKYIVYICAILSAIMFMIGWFFIKKGFWLRTALDIPILYAAGSLILCEVMNRYAFVDINNVLSNFGGVKLTMTFSTNLVPVFVFAVICIILEFAALHADRQKK